MHYINLAAQQMKRTNSNAVNKLIGHKRSSDSNVLKAHSVRPSSPSENNMASDNSMEFTTADNMTASPPFDISTEDTTTSSPRALYNNCTKLLKPLADCLTENIYH